MHDLFPDLMVPYSLAIRIAAAYCGPALGPLVASYLVPEQGRRWGMWEIVWLAAPTLILMFTLPETHGPTIRVPINKATNGPSQTGTTTCPAITVALKYTIVRPIQITLQDPAVAVANLYFLDWCKSNRILVAIFPPHATHRLQPLDVSMFRPLATYYSQELDRHTRQSQGFTSLTKRDFFHNFDRAYCKAFTEANISSEWLKTGLEPFNPAEVLQIFDNGKANELTHANTPYGSQSPRELADTCLPTPTRLRSIRRLVGGDHGSDFQRALKKLADTCVAFATELTLPRDGECGYIEALNNQKKK
jgi:hypothetical protein